MIAMEDNLAIVRILSCIRRATTIEDLKRFARNLATVRERTENGTEMAIQMKWHDRASFRKIYPSHKLHDFSKQNRSTEGCSKFKSLEARQVHEKLVSTLEHLQVQKSDRTSCPAE